MKLLTRQIDPDNERGATLLYVIISIVVFSFFGGILYSHLSTSNMAQINTSFTTRAVHLGQSGYRYFTAAYKNTGPSAFEKHTVMETLNGKTFRLNNNDGTFTININPYYYRSSDSDKTLDIGNNTLDVRFPGNETFTIPTFGELAVYLATGYKYFSYNGITDLGSGNYRLSNISSTDFPIQINQGNSIMPVLHPGTAVTFSEGGSLVITDPVPILPPRYGFFEINGDSESYIYYYADRNGNSLDNIRTITDPTLSFTHTLDTSSKIIVHTSALILSTGSFSGNTSHTFSRLALLGYTSGGNSDNSGDTSSFTDDGSGNPTDNWNWQNDDLNILQAKDNALEIKINNQGDGMGSGTVALDWENIPNFPSFEEARVANGGLLSYEMQMKIKIDNQGLKGNHYMLGLSFRLNGTDSFSGDAYGVSFFRSYSNAPDNKKPAWLKHDNFATIANLGDPEGTVNAVLWKKINGVYSVLYSEQLTPGNEKGVVSGGELKDWSAIIVNVEETETSNNIHVSVQGTDIYPRDTIHWDYTQFNPVVDTPDSSLTTDNYYPPNPEEVGIHAFYDSPAGNDEFVDDFSIRVVGADNSGGTGIPGF